MSEQRPPLTQSLSLSESSSTSTFPRPPKRRYTSVQESDFFTQSASTFYPRPYTHVDRERGDKSFIARSARAIDNLGLNTRGTDPDPTDPRTFIIHPPFTTFPGSERYPEGLTYQLLADNPEWFLDALDFVSTTADSSTATPYPPSLEPPRGWCPAKKKDLKNRGADGWPEGEEPRLRCTFCRRTYAGVNARSMWRRHVYEKHKIAMSNRRDGGDKPRGRGSNKENRGGSQKGLLDFDVIATNETASQGSSYKSTFRSSGPARHRSSSPSAQPKYRAASSSQISQDTFMSSDDSGPAPPVSQPMLSSVSPPPSPPSPQLVDSDTSFETSTSIPSPLPNLPIIPPSPYNPLQTPSFKHSPPRLPSDQPWRFPSPSHPLHSVTREVCLSTLAGNLIKSPSVKSSPSDGSIPATPDNFAKGYRRSPKTLFTNSDKISRFPFATRLRLRYEIDSSPLRQSSKFTKHISSSQVPSSDDWPSDTLVLETISPDRDPFTRTWKSTSGSTVPGGDSAPPLSIPDVDSPVVHKHIGSKAASGGPTLAGLGVGLLEPFRLPDDSDSPVDDIDFETEENSPVDTTAVKTGMDLGHIFTPPSKRRKT
ncbi:hypothetical protein PLEOSDRAFT_1101677 [Pleurotus ostreatus PC15]|uniref:Uncharacterized protein n=2 Tax=Pleurotus TaxID=5320 RepID=A0A067P2Q7_PLEO1|nr:hypothetical protein CCMSSC00406_0000405 [Pleurotus cornucopiae]KDQ30692.1 hypothetical protein PLEOSDRAFT_1101677 [Pleurotus ostreatus PC15]